VIYRVSHLTEYLYSAPVSSSHHQLHLLPRRQGRQINRWEELSIDPTPTRQHERADYFGNRATHLEIQEAHRRLAVLSRSEIEVVPAEATLPTIAPPWEVVREQVRQPRTAEQIDLYEFVFASPYVHVSPGVIDFAAGSFTPRRPIVEAAIDLMHRIHDEFVYDGQATTVSTPVDDVLASRRGVCQDFAHLALGCLRGMGLPARYVSGYLVTAIPGQPRLVGADASHAWVQSYCPGVGWLDLDPTNDVIPTDKHITVAYGRDFGDVTPLRGVIMGGGRHELRVVVDVQPLAAEGAVPSTQTQRQSNGDPDEPTQ
jgi:transglutaminase-like putative cysteine protease